MCYHCSASAPSPGECCHCHEGVGKMSFCAGFRWFFSPCGLLASDGHGAALVSAFVSSLLGDSICNTMDKTHIILQFIRKKFYLAKLCHSSGGGWVLTTPWAVSQKQKILFLSKCEIDFIYLDIQSICLRLCNVLHRAISMSLLGFKESFSRL